MTASRRAWTALLVVIGALVPVLPATAAPRLRCQVDQGGVTRVLAHAHFASDVMLGALAGWATAALLWRRFGERRPPPPR